MCSGSNLTWLSHKLQHFTTYLLKCHLPMAVVILLSLLPSYFCPSQTSLLHSRSVSPTSIWPFPQGHLTITSNPNVWNGIYPYSNTYSSYLLLLESPPQEMVPVVEILNSSDFCSLHIQLMIWSYRITNVLKCNTSLHDHFHYPDAHTSYPPLITAFILTFYSYLKTHFAIYISRLPPP